jgi:hypothetical protein
MPHDFFIKNLMMIILQNNKYVQTNFTTARKTYEKMSNIEHHVKIHGEHMDPHSNRGFCNFDLHCISYCWI